jgi:Fic family protein
MGFLFALADATFWLGQLSDLSRELEFQPLLYTSLLRKEAMESAEIEGVDVDYNALYSLETKQVERGDGAAAGQAPGTGTEHTQEVLNYEAAITHGIEKLDAGTSLSVELLHDLHEILLTDVPSERVETETIGAYKRVSNHLGDFLPPVPDATPGLMDALLTYHGASGRYHPLIDIALFHYQFETIPPYGDGNGRLGRPIITLQLYASGYLQRQTSTSVGIYIGTKPSTSIGWKRSGLQGSGSLGCSSFIEGLATQAEEAVERTIELEQLRQRYFEEYGGVEYTKHKLACWLLEQLYLTSTTVQQQFDVTNATALRAIYEIVDAGVLEKTTDKARNQEFREREIFAILERPPTTY